MTTDGPTVERNNRRTRWFHTAAYTTTLILIGTGLWFTTGHEGQPTPLARLLNQPDTDIHRRVGYGLVALAVLAVTLGVRAAWTFVIETLRAERGDLRWFVHWPVGALTGRFARHRGHFDPGQRVANVLFVASFSTLIVSGIGLTTVQGGETFATLVKVHRWATYALAALVVVHVVVAIGVLPGYRGVWRAMHWRGRVPLATARRLWPSWATRHRQRR
jgi:cytochrome b subunit of formate dehydrogenase